MSNVFNRFFALVLILLSVIEVNAQSASCQEDVCSLFGLSMENEIKSTVLIQGLDANNNLKQATGVLLNNTSYNGIGYILTSARFISSIPTSNHQGLEFFFNYEKDCSTNYIPPNPSLVTKKLTGATVLAIDAVSGGAPQTSDYCLLQLLDGPTQLQALGVCYSGWNTDSQIATNNFNVLHHPMGDIKKGTIGTNLQYISGNPDYYNMDLIAGHGGYENVSEGGSVYNYLNELVGNIFGSTGTGQNPCAPSSDYKLKIGSFYRHWINGNFQQWLDPNNTGNAMVGAYCPSLGNGGGGGAANPSWCFMDNGISLNGKNDAIVKVCPTNHFDVTTLTNGLWQCWVIHREQVPCEDGFDEEDEYQAAGKCFSLNGICSCEYFDWAVHIQEQDYFLGSVGPVYSKTYSYRTPDGPIFVGFDITDFPGLILVPGKYYSVSVGQLKASNWVYGNKMLYILPPDLNINNQNVAMDLYSMNDITIQNSTIAFPKEVATTHQIEILPSSNLLSGNYYIKQIDCNTFRMANSSASTLNNNPKSSNNINSQLEVKNDLKLNDDKNRPEIFKVYPNPTSNTFEVSYISQLPYSLHIYNMLGEMIESKTNIQVPYVSCDLTNQSSGIYLVKIVSGGRTLTKRVVRN